MSTIIPECAETKHAQMRAFDRFLNIDSARRRAGKFLVSYVSVGDILELPKLVLPANPEIALNTTIRAARAFNIVANQDGGYEPLSYDPPQGSLSSYLGGLVSETEFNYIRGQLNSRAEEVLTPLFETMASALDASQTHQFT